MFVECSLNDISFVMCMYRSVITVMQLSSELSHCDLSPSIKHAVDLFVYILFARIKVESGDLYPQNVLRSLKGQTNMNLNLRRRSPNFMFPTSRRKLNPKSPLKFYNERFRRAQLTVLILSTRL